MKASGRGRLNCGTVPGKVVHWPPNCYSWGMGSIVSIS
jgi:hypothetical protein